jgi:trehalose/maltose hydrolase-like predicted phosphorylase
MRSWPSSTGTATARTYGNIGRLDLILESEGDTTNRYRVSKQADVLMLFYLISAETLIVCSQPSASVCDVITVRSSLESETQGQDDPALRSSATAAPVILEAHRVI